MNRSLAAILLVAAVLANADEQGTRRFIGTGRACNGTLSVTPTKLSWQTTFSRCPESAYKVLDRSAERTVFRLDRVAPTCRYGVLALVHHEPDKPDIAWEVIGYRDEPGYRADEATGFTSNPPDMLSCYLYREPDPAARAR